MTYGNGSANLPVNAELTPGAVNFEVIDQFFQLGDANRDGKVDFLDISPFISILSSGDYFAEADTNQDGVVDFLDISSFIRLLSGT